jgi:polyhydroxyalkanoate synthesis regulator phasin
VNRSIAETQEVRQAVESVERRLQAMQQGLEEIARRTRDPQIKSEIEALSGQVQRSQEVTRTPDRFL